MNLHFAAFLGGGGIDVAYLIYYSYMPKMCRSHPDFEIQMIIYHSCSESALYMQFNSEDPLGLEESINKEILDEMIQ